MGEFGMNDPGFNERGGRAWVRGKAPFTGISKTVGEREIRSGPQAPSHPRKT